MTLMERAANYLRQIENLQEQVAVRDAQIDDLRKRLESETARVSFVFENLRRHRAVLIAVRSHFGRDLFHALLPDDLREHVIREIGDGVQ
jgi:hypothetical protein